MIYLIVFIYLLYLSVRYDILGREDYRWTHYRIAVTLLILVGGASLEGRLRYGFVCV